MPDAQHYPTSNDGTMRVQYAWSVSCDRSVENSTKRVTRVVDSVASAPDSVSLGYHPGREAAQCIFHGSNPQENNADMPSQ